MKRLLLFFAFLLSFTKAHSQAKVHYLDTVFCENINTSLWKQSLDGALELSLHVFDCDSELGELLGYTTNQDTIAQFITKEKTRIVFKKYVHIRGNKFSNESDVSMEALTSSSQETCLTFKDGFDIGNNYFNGQLQLHKLEFTDSDSLANSSGFGYNSFGSLALNTVSGGELRITNNVFKNEELDDEVNTFLIDNGQLRVLSFTNNTLEDDISSLLFKKTTFNDGVVIANNSFRENLTSTFTNDTVNNVFYYSKNTGKLQVIVFQNCLINGGLSIKKANNPQSISLKFINCSFGNNVSMIGLQVDTIIFNGCINIPSNFPLSSDNISVTQIQLYKSKIDNIGLDYLGQFKILPNSGSNIETKVLSTYETMLAKFKTEGRLESYKNLDIEYKKFMYSQNGLWGSLASFIDRIWWNYSYSKFYILWWTFAFLIAFCVINFIKWTSMQKVYSIMNKADGNNSRPLKRSFLLVFLYTAFIFLGLRIDFDKLDYKNKSGVTLFFVEYIVGLACVFFILNAILKI